MSSHGAQPSAKLSTPLTEPAWWIFRNSETKNKCQILEKTWMAARAKAAQSLGCHVDELECIGSPFIQPINRTIGGSIVWMAYTLPKMSKRKAKRFGLVK